MVDEALGVRWVTAFVDVPRDAFQQAARFWGRVTGSGVSATWGEYDEFVTLQPPEGDPYLAIQGVGDSGGVHVDLHVDTELGQAVQRATSLGATVRSRLENLVVLISPSGMPFCLFSEEATRTRPGTATWEGGIRSRVDQVCLAIPSTDFDVEADFWSGLTGWERRAGALPEFDYLQRPDAVPIRLLLQRTGDPSGRGRAHLDLAAGADLEGEVERQVGLGATVVGHRARWVTMRDPTGQEYCITERDPDTGRLSS